MSNGLVFLLTSKSLTNEDVILFATPSISELDTYVKLNADTIEGCTNIVLIAMRSEAYISGDRFARLTLWANNIFCDLTGNMYRKFIDMVSLNIDRLSGAPGLPTVKRIIKNLIGMRKSAYELTVAGSTIDMRGYSVSDLEELKTDIDTIITRKEYDELADKCAKDEEDHEEDGE